MPVLCLNNWTYRHRFFSHLEGVTLVRLGPPPLQNSNGPRLVGVVNTQGGGTICNFQPKSPFISEMVRYRAVVTMDKY